MCKVAAKDHTAKDHTVGIISDTHTQSLLAAMNNPEHAQTYGK